MAGELGEALGDLVGDPLAGRERGRGSDDAAPDPGLEVAADAGGDRRGPAVALEPLEVEAEGARSLPEVGIVLAALVGVDRVAGLPESGLALRRSRLGRGVQGRRPGVLAGDRKVAQTEPQLELPDPYPGGRTVRAGEVEVDDRLRAGAARVVIGLDWRNWRAAESVPGQLAARASKIRLAPGISSGVGDSWTQRTIPSSSTRTRERLSWPRSSM